MINKELNFCLKDVLGGGRKSYLDDKNLYEMFEEILRITELGKELISSQKTISDYSKEQNLHHKPYVYFLLHHSITTSMELKW